jgi:hypothetical protein
MELEADKASLCEKIKFLEGEREKIELELRQVIRLVEYQRVPLKLVKHTYHSRLIPEGVAETSQIFLRDT